MIFGRKTHWSIFGVAVIIGSLISCSAIYVMKVHYQVPWKEEGFKGKKVFLSFQDERPDKKILTRTAEKELGSFSESFSFSWGHADQPGVRMGHYDLEGMFKEAFDKRLENLGVDVVKARGDSRVELVIALKTFQVGLAVSTWQVTLEYEARLLKGGEVRAKQFIRGQAERFKWLGRGELDKAVSEIFSDTVNRLDLERLYGLADMGKGT